MVIKRILVLGAFACALATGIGAWWWQAKPRGPSVAQIHEPFRDPPPPPGGAKDRLDSQSDAGCGPLETPARVAVAVRGDDGDTQRFSDALSHAMETAPDIRVVQQAQDCSVIAFIPDHVNWKRYNGRTIITYRVNAWRQRGPFMGTYTGSCWLDQVAACGEAAARDIAQSIRATRQ